MLRQNLIRQIAFQVATLSVLCPMLFGQTAPGPLPSSGLEWRQAAMPLQYWDATGRRAAVFGRQDGKFEAWVWPIKVLHGFRLEFKQDGMPEAVRGEDWLREVITRPESTTLIYVHPKFTVREIVWTPIDKPSVDIFFEVDSAKPLNITAKFVPDFKPMWPASFGGQHSWWIAEEKAFGLADALEKHVAIIGSPAVAAYTDFTDHSLIGGEMLLGIRVEPHPSKSGLGRPPALLAISLGMAGEKEARANYESAVQHAREEYEAKAAYWKEFLDTTTQIETPDPVLNRAWIWGKVAMHSGWVCTPVPGHPGVGEGDRAGCGMVAGYGPAGDGERPGFAWWFGGDGLIATWAMEDYGDLPGALQEFRFLKARQREDGKITHEIVQSIGLVDWFKDFHFAYMHADTTPMYLYSLGQYWQRTGDRRFLEEFWPSAKKAYAWCVSVTDTDGLMDNTKAGLGAIEVGVLKGKVTKDIYLEGFWVGALQQMADMAGAAGDRQLADDAAARLKQALQSLDTQWWDPEQKYFAFGITAQGERAMMPGNWPATLAAIAPIDEAKAREEMGRLAQPDLSSDWGLRGISDFSPLYDPVSYNNGTVWPYTDTFAAWADYRWGLPLAGYASLRDTANLTGMQSPGYMPEHMNGTYFEPGERSVPHQLFSTAGVIVPMVRGLIGARVTTNPGDAARPIVVELRPAIPPQWKRMSFTHLKAGAADVSGEITNTPGKMIVRLEGGSREPVWYDVIAALPLGAADVRWRARSISADSMASGGTGAHAQMGANTPVEFTFEYKGGVAIVPPTASPGAGDRSSALKLIRATASGTNSADIQLAGRGGQSYQLHLVTTVANLTVDGATVSKTDDGYRLEIPFEGGGYVTREIKVRW